MMTLALAAVGNGNEFTTTTKGALCFNTTTARVETVSKSLEISDKVSYAFEET